MPFKKGNIPWNKGLSKETDIRLAKMGEKVSKTLSSIPMSAGRLRHLKELHSMPRTTEWKDKISKSNTGKLSSQWIDGRTNTPEYKRYVSRARKALQRGAGKLSVKVIQMVYEDNIKKYGTLTCYLCLNTIAFGDDHLEHKTPLIRGGNNDYENLAIACSSCNHKKHSKTEEEFREYQSA